MTEAEWLTGTDPQRMLDWLLACWGGKPSSSARQVRGSYRSVVSDRKLRLFVEACREREQETIGQQASYASLESSYLAVAVNSWCQDLGTKHPSMAERAAMLRDIFGNPFRPWSLGDCICDGRGWRTRTEGEPSQGQQERRPCELCLAPWLTWNDGTVMKIAQTIYADCDFGLMPMLGDALEEAGCDNEDILRHCRGQERCWICIQTNSDPLRDACSNCGQLGAVGPFGRPCAPGWVAVGEHARGCWVLDLLLGKE